ncbi:MAG: 4-hydroxythreonine-4-phosphate dehydrogenase PdxA [Bacteroidota bacterium]
MEKIRLGITMGDINGIGAEVIIKTLSNSALLEYCTPIVYGSSKIFSYHKKIVKADDLQVQNLNSADRPYTGRINVVNCWQENVTVTLGKATEDGGKYAYIALDKATEDINNGLIDVLVTAPINKEAMKMADFPYPGHTEYLTQKFGGSQSLMMMVNDSLRVGLLSNHIPVSEVASKVTKEHFVKKLKIFNRSLKQDFGKERPTIAVLGLNPHAGDNGTIGKEDLEILRPAIIEAKKNGAMVMGPYPADGFFGNREYQKFDGILAMYHDQGLIPFKTISFGNGVNFTAGLKIVRTSPDHGTAYNIAGKNEADPSSFRNAVYNAIDIFRNRKDHSAIHANPIEKKPKPLEEKE